MARLLIGIAGVLAMAGVAAAAPPDDPARLPPPDPAQGERYDGRTGDHDHLDALAVPRLLLYPVRLIFIAAEPGVRSGISFDQRHHVSQHIYDAITWREGMIGIRPEVHWELSFRPSFGVRFFDDRLMGLGTSFVAVATAGPDVWHGEVIARPTPFSFPVQLAFGAMFDRRNDRLFAGIDNSVPVLPGELGASRYLANIFDFNSAVSFHLVQPLVLSFGAAIGWRRYGNGESFNGDPPIDVAYCPRLGDGTCASDTVDPLLVPGFNSGTQFVRPSATLTLDLRDSPVHSSTGLLVVASADYTHGFANDDSSYVRFRGAATLPINLGAPRYVLVLRAATEFIAPFGSAPVPFTELPTLGGPDDLRGFRNQLFHGRSSFIASAEYRFPVWIWMDFVLFADYGGVFGQWYQGFGARQLQPDLGGGLLLFGRNRFFLRVQVAYGWGEGWRISLATRSWPWP